MRVLVHVFFIILFLLAAFFGIGPVLFADGALKERLITGVVVVIILIAIMMVYRRTLNRMKKR